jgi:hypothetical protein
LSDFAGVVMTLFSQRSKGAVCQFLVVMGISFFILSWVIQCQSSLEIAMLLFSGLEVFVFDGFKIRGCDI